MTELERALSDHRTGLLAALDPQRARLEALARQWSVDEPSELALAARAKDPAGYEAQLRAMGVSPLGLSFYAVGREAAIRVGTFVPATTEDPSS